MKTIGVVGGVGPLAGVDFQKKIISQTRAARDQDHLEVVTVSFPGRIPDRTAYLLGETDRNPAGPIAEQLALLEKAGADIGAIPCNTAHAPRIFDQVKEILGEKGGKLKLLNMSDEVAGFLSRSFARATGIGVLCTLGTYQTRLYDEALGRNGFSSITPDFAGKRDVHEAIYSRRHGVKSLGVNDVARGVILGVIKDLKTRGARAVILGCTELPLVIPEETVMDLPVIDPTLILARAAVREAAPDKLIPWKGIGS